MFISRQAFKPEEVLKYISDWLVIIDENLKIIKVNDEFAKRYSALKNNFNGEEFVFFVAENNRESLKSNMIELIYKDDAKKIKIRDIYENIYEISVKHLPHNIIGNGKAAIVLKDITEYERELEVLRLEKEKIEKKNIDALEILAELSHEIKMSAGGMSGIIDYVMETRLDEQQKKYLTILKKSSDGITKLLGDIIDFKGVEVEATKLENYKFDIEGVVDEAVSTFIGNAYTKNVEILYYVDSDIPPRIMGDAGRLKQILTNIIGNAVKFSHNGEILVFVKKTDEDEESILLEFVIKDTGIGMSKDKLEKIKEYISNGVKGYNDNNAKNGIGFIISHKLIELMGGTLSIKSIKGTGTTVKFNAVFKKSKEQTVVVTEKQVLNNKFEIIIADENLKSRIVMAKILKDMGCKVRFTGKDRFKEIINSTEGNKLIVSDTKVARKEIVEYLDEIAEREDVRIVLMKCWPDDRRYKELERYPVVSKPFSKNDINKMVHNVAEDFAINATVAKPFELGKEELKHRAKILLVEDNIINQELTTILIKKIGLDVDIASNGREAVEKFQTNTYGLILMDIQMPEMNGIEATMKIRELEKNTGNRMTIIAMTAYAIEGDREKCYEAGMDEYLSKPLKIDELYGLIRKTLKITDTNEIPQLEKIDFQTKDTDPINMEELFESVGRDEKIMERFIEITMKSYPIKLLRIKESIENRDFKTMEFSSHGFKGSIGSISKKVFRLSNQLEQSGRESKSEGIEEAFKELEKEMQDIEAFIKARKK